MNNFFKTAKKFQTKLGFYRQKIEINEPEFRMGELFLDWEPFERNKQFSFFEIGDYNQDENGWIYECVPRNRSIRGNDFLGTRFPEDFPWAEQGRKNEFFNADSLLKINSMKQILDLYRQVK